MVDIRTIGLMAGIELAPRADAAGSRAYDVFADYFPPPLIANDSHVDAIVSILADALKRAA